MPTCTPLKMQHLGRFSSINRLSSKRTRTISTSINMLGFILKRQRRVGLWTSRD